MNTQLNIIAKMKDGEIIKGFVNKTDFEYLKQNGSVYVTMANESNTIGAYIHQSHLTGLFIVKNFEGAKPSLFKRIINDSNRLIKDNIALIGTATAIALFSLLGLLSLL